MSRRYAVRQESRPGPKGCYGIEGIPSQWRKTVENREYLEQLGKQLWDVKTGAGQEALDDVVGEAAVDTL